MFPLIGPSDHYNNQQPHRHHNLRHHIPLSVCLDLLQPRSHLFFGELCEIHEGAGEGLAEDARRDEQPGEVVEDVENQIVEVEDEAE